MPVQHPCSNAEGRFPSQAAKKEPSQIRVPSPTPTLLRRDCNSDVGVRMGDVAKVEGLILALDEPTHSADANQDGIVNTGDVTRVETIVLAIAK